MITNERQYWMSRRWLERFTEARASVDEQSQLPVRAQQAFRDQYDSQIEELRQEIAECDSLRSGEITVLELNSLRELPEALIRARGVAVVPGRPCRAPRP